MRSSLVPSFLLALAACGGGSSGTPDTDPQPDAAAPTDPDASPPAPTKVALVEVRLEPPLFQGGTPRLRIAGGFEKALDPRCQRTTIGNCEVSDCPQALIGTDWADPGKLSFAPSGGLIAFSPGPSFLSFSADVIPWAANETITLTSAGAEVPAFSASVASPRTLDAGEGRSPSGPPIVKTQPFTATWVPIAEQVKLELSQPRDTPNGPFRILVACEVPGSSGSGTVPPAALARFLPQGSGGLSVQVTAHAMRETATTAGDYAVTYRVLRSFDESFFHPVQ